MQGAAKTGRYKGEAERKASADPATGGAGRSTEAGRGDASEEELKQDLEGQLVFSFAVEPSLELIRETLHRLRRLVDKYYPRQTPTQRIGHEFSSDALAIVGRLTHVSGGRSGVDSGNDASAGSSHPAIASDCVSLWSKEFPAGTALDLTPLEVERLIATRKRQISELDDEITLLQRRLNRLRDIDVRLC